MAQTCEAHSHEFSNDAVGYYQRSVDLRTEQAKSQKALAAKATSYSRQCGGYSAGQVAPSEHGLSLLIGDGLRQGRRQLSRCSGKNFQ